MRAQSVNFQRGQDPKDSMDIGVSNDEVKKDLLRQEFPGLDIDFKDYYGGLIATVWYPDEGYPEESEDQFMEVHYYWDDEANEWTPDV